MEGTCATTSPGFSEAARRVQHRLFVRRWLQLLLSTWRIAAGLAVVLVVLRLLGLPGLNWKLGVTVFAVLWPLGCFATAWWRRVDAYAALAFWDRAASRGEAFANAWWFESQPDEQRTKGQRFHLQAQARVLPAALDRLPQEVAWPDARWLPLLPVLAVALLLIPVGHGFILPDPILGDEARALSKAEGKRLAERKLDSEKMSALTPQEKAEMEKLQANVQDTAKALENQEAKTAREVLSELERRAREAERLAEKLAAGEGEWASDEMVAEMRRHTDTSALGDEVSRKAAAPTAREAQVLADKLKAPDLTAGAKERFAGTLGAIGRQAQPGDKERTVGQHVIAADTRMTQSLPQDAAREFQALADKMRTLAAREQVREQIEKLAQQLREAGSNVAGQGTQGMQQLSGSPESQGGQGTQSQQGLMNLANAPQGMPALQPPGMSNPMQNNSQSGQGQGLRSFTPQPGNNAQQGRTMQMAPSGKPGQGKPDQPMLFAPVPGGDPNRPPDGFLLGQGSISLSPGGSEPGNATSKPEGAPTGKSNPGQASTVNAQRNNDGRSSVRSIEGAERTGGTARSTEAVAIEAIAAEESALDDAALPPARREQVRRYFTELRKRFETAP